MLGERRVFLLYLEQMSVLHYLMCSPVSVAVCLLSVLFMCGVCVLLNLSFGACCYFDARRRFFKEVPCAGAFPEVSLFTLRIFLSIFIFLVLLTGIWLCMS